MTERVHTEMVGRTCSQDAGVAHGDGAHKGGDDALHLKYRRPAASRCDKKTIVPDMLGGGIVRVPVMDRKTVQITGACILHGHLEERKMSILC